MIVESVRRFSERYGITACRIAAAVSGGTDSTALLLALADLRADGFEIVCAHVNHHLRGAESDEDERFVRQLCERLEIECHAADGSLDAGSVREHGVEAAARHVRTARLQELRAAAGTRYIATAHQMNDQAETVVMRLMSGSGIAGLRGIHPVREDAFIRPLLNVPRSAIEAFLRDRGVTPRVDRMNADPRYLRVRVRDMLRSFDDTAIANIAGVADQARELWASIERQLDAADQKLVEATAGEVRFDGWPDDPWLRRALLHRHIQRLEPTREISAADLSRIDTELSTITRLSVTKSLELVRRGTALVLRRRPVADTEEFEVALQDAGEVYVPSIGATVTIRRASAKAERVSPDRAVQVIQLPAGSAPDFRVRNRRDGDRFQPLGLGSSKKLKDFLIDRKIPADDRDRIPLVVWKGEIAWVAGVEVGERFKVTGGEGDLYELSLRRESEQRGASSEQTPPPRLASPGDSSQSEGGPP